MTSVDQCRASSRSSTGGVVDSSRDAATLPLVSPHASSVAGSTSSRNSPSDAVSSYGIDAEVAALRGALAAARAEVAALSAELSATRAEAETRIEVVRSDATRQASLDARRIAELEVRLAAAAHSPKSSAPHGTPSPPQLRSSPSVLSPSSAVPRARAKAAAWDAAASGSCVGLAAALRAWGPECLTEADEGGNACLHAAARGGHVDAVRDLIAAGADPLLKNKVGGCGPPGVSPPRLLPPPPPFADRVAGLRCTLLPTRARRRLWLCSSR